MPGRGTENKQLDKQTHTEVEKDNEEKIHQSNWLSNCLFSVPLPGIFFPQIRLLSFPHYILLSPSVHCGREDNQTVIF